MLLRKYSAYPASPGTSAVSLWPERTRGDTHITLDFGSCWNIQHFYAAIGFENYSGLIQITLHVLWGPGEEGKKPKHCNLK